MNELGGIVNLDGAPVSAGHLESLQCRSGNVSSLLSSNVGIFFCAYDGTLSEQPFNLMDGSILAFDGVLQNRQELARALKLRNACADVAIVAAGLSCHGPEFLKRMLGSFAFVWWDQLKRRLVMARDHIGSRPLYYRLNDQQVRFASEITVLLDDSSFSNLNNDYIAGFLGVGPKTQLTPYRDISSVKPAHILELTNDRVLEYPFWTLSSEKRIYYKTAEDYEEHFKSLAFEAVATIFATTSTPIFAELSGGLDSSAIVCIADEVTSRLGQPQIETLSRVHDEARSSDEREFIELVERKRNRPSHYIREEDFPLLSSRDTEPSLAGPNPFYCFGDYHRAVCGTLERSGSRTLISGKGGDQILGGNPSGVPQLADALVQGNLIAFGKNLRTWSLADRAPCFPLIRDSLRTVLKMRAPRILEWPTHHFPNWISQPFRKQMIIDATSGRSAGKYRLPSQLDQSAGFFSVVSSISAQYRRQWGKIEVMYPWLYQPLVDFMQSIPFDQKVRPGETRSLMRRALRSTLPPRIVTRRGKRSPSEALVRAIRREFPRLTSLLEDPLIAQYGYADQSELRTTLLRAREGADLTSLSIVMAISLEVWLRKINGLKTV